jgi:hypothetical protein
MKFRNKNLTISRSSAAFSGKVMGPGDDGYEDGRKVYYGNVDRHPALIARPKDASDVAAILSFARLTGMELAVYGGGHSLAGYGVPEGGVMLDMRDMRSLVIDTERQTAWAESGLTAGEYNVATGKHGLATGFGDTASVGIGGITLGGGIGYLVRKYGLTIDSLLAVQMVTADGQILFVDETTSPDLFWAIRGGGGNFGVVTRFQYRLHLVDRILGGMLVLPGTRAVIHDLVAAAEAAPEELSIIANIMPAPPMPFLPADVQGKPVAFVNLVHVGDLDEAEQNIAPFRKLASPLYDGLRHMRYKEMFPPEKGGFQQRLSTRSLFTDRIDRSHAEWAIESLQASAARMSILQIRVLGGAMARVAEEATAFAHRERKLMITLAAVYERQEEADVHELWAMQAAEGLSDDKPGVYVNFMGNEGEARLRDAYPGQTWNRLVEIKTKYDPANLFHLNQNIPPRTDLSSV